MKYFKTILSVVGVLQFFFFATSNVFASTTKPTLTVVSPTSKTSTSNDLFAVTGTTKDKVPVTGVYYSLNGSDWSEASTGNGWTNWFTPGLPLIPGTNMVQAYAVDTSGNDSTTNKVSFLYVVPEPLIVQINGLWPAGGAAVSPGTVSPNYNGMMLDVAVNYAMTAKAKAGFVFTNWTGSWTTNKATLKFRMTTNLTFTANFADVQKPTVSIVLPKVNEKWSNSVITVSGIANDNVGVAGVYYSLNGSDWGEASTGNDWTNWFTPGLPLIPGTNMVQAYAVDTSGNVSTTNKVSFLYVVPEPLNVQINGLWPAGGVAVSPGTVSPNYNGMMLDVAVNYAMTAKAKAGFVFTNWTGSWTTNKATLKFRMTTNLTFTANFADVQKPTVSIVSPKANEKWSNSVFTASGIANDNVGVAGVYYSLNGSDWSEASTGNGWINWFTPDLQLTPGTNMVQAYAVDTSGNVSTTDKVSFNYVLTAPLTVLINGNGTVNPNYDGVLLQIGETYSMTAKPTKDYEFSGWSGSFSNILSTLKFTMQSNLTISANFSEVPTLSAKSVIPFQYLTINGDFQTNVTTTVQFTFGTNDFPVTPTVVTTNMIRVAVPPLLKGQTFVGGSADVSVLQSDGTNMTSLLVGTIQIADLPIVKLPTGTVTASFINVAEGILTNAQATISGSSLDTSDTANDTATGLAFFNAMTANITGFMSATLQDAIVSTNSSDYSVTLTEGTVQEMDRYFAGIIAAGALNTTDPQMVLAYKSWEDAIQLPPGQTYDAAAQLNLLQAEQNYQQIVNSGADEVAEGLNTMMAPLTATVASLNIAALASGNPAVIAQAWALAACSDALTAGLIFGLALDAEYYALNGNNQLYQVYSQAEWSLSQDFFIGKALALVIDLAQLPEQAGLLVDLRDLQMTFDAEEAPVQTENQPASPTGTIPPTPDYTLATGTAGTGTGTVSIYPPGLKYADGTIVTLTATPQSGSTFTGWSGDASGNNNPTVITIDSNKSVTAIFAQNNSPDIYSLDIGTTGSGSGTVTVSPPGPTYTNGTVVTLTAHASTGSTFAGWSGDASGSGSSIKITMDADESVTATFNNPNIWSGTWTGTMTLYGPFDEVESSDLTWVLTQSGNNVHGTYINDVYSDVDDFGDVGDEGIYTGTLLDGSVKNGVLTISTDGGSEFTGTISADGQSISGTGGDSLLDGSFTLQKN